MSEILKYQQIYQSGKMPRYGHSNHGARSIALLEKWQAKSVLDVGCGFNEFSKAVSAKMGIEAVGVDFACPGADIVCPASKLPFQDGQFDVVTSFDMLEHLLPDEVDATLDEMRRVSSRFIVSIAYVDSVNKWNGKTLHPTVRPEHWWITRLIRAGAVAIAKHGRFITGKWRNPLKIKKGSSIILIGNGPSALSVKKGAFIDSFDEVIRFNNFTTEGFWEFVGRKTTLWSAFFKKAEDKPKFPRAFCIHEKDNPLPGVAVAYCMASWFYDRVRKQVQERALWASGFTRNTEPLLASSGMLLASYLLDVVGVEQLFVTGFDHFSKVRSGQHHYWMPQSFKKPAEHDGDIEKSMFDELVQVGRIIRV